MCGRGRCPKHLRLPRGEHPEHPEFQEGLSRRSPVQARTELPVHGHDRVGCELRHREEYGSDSEGNLDSKRRRRKNPRHPQRLRQRGGPLRRIFHLRSLGAPPGPLERLCHLVPHECPVARVRGKLAQVEPAVPDLWRAVVLPAEGGQRPDRVLPARGESARRCGA